MLSALRRGPASFAKFSQRCPSTKRDLGLPFVRCIQSPIYPRSLSATRTLSYSPHHGQYASARAPGFDSGVEHEVNASRSRSDNHSQKGIQHGPVTRFQELLDRGLVCDTVVDTITKDMGLETMTQVQSMTISESLKGIDVLAQARTGTGKTLAFLIPVLQNIINYDPTLQHRSRERVTPQDIRAIIVSPTRELAEQIAVEARKLTRNTGVIVQTAVGGSAKRYHLGLMQREGCHILVGTPGRLNDILSDPHSGARAPDLSAFVLDEADRLLDAGFAPEIQNIQRQLPNKREVDRQTLLYSATVPEEVMSVVRQTMKRDFKYVRTVQEGELQTHEKVPQEHVVVRGFTNFLPAILELCNRELARQDRQMPFKAIVYFGPTAEVTLAAETFRNLQSYGQRGLQRDPISSARIIEIHARLSQQQRTRAAESFRRANSAIMFSSDVTARGMDFPNVTHVIQVGAPKDRNTYIHRLGRTGRSDKPGEGWLLTPDFEVGGVRHLLHDMPISKNTSLKTSTIDMSRDAQLPEDVAKILTQVLDATKPIPGMIKSNAYIASLGYTSTLSNRQHVIDALNDRARDCWAMEEPPAVSPRLVQKIGLSRTRGLNIGSERPLMDRDRPSRSAFSDFPGESGYDGRRQGYPSRSPREGSGFDGRRRDSSSMGGQGGYQRGNQRAFQQSHERGGGGGFDSQQGRSSREKRWF